MARDGVQKAGDVDIQRLVLITSTNTVIDLTEFLVELNIYEDMFSSYLRGSIVLSDSRNLIEKGPIIGEEFVSITIQTPSFPDVIKKTFKVFKLSDRKIVRDNSTQIFTLHFASVELFYDILLPIFTSFEGTITDVAAEVFSNYIASTRDYNISGLSQSEGGGPTTVDESTDETPMYILNESLNKVKFVSPGWTPFKILNWLASKSIPKNETAKNFLFFESTKAFYFGSVEYLLKDVAENDSYIGEYTISASNIRDGANSPDIDREYFIAKDVDMVDTTDGVKNFTNGYLANRLITLDVYNKKYETIDYDYTQEYEKQWHTSGSGATAIPIFTKDGVRNFATNISFYPVNPKLYNDFTDNVNEKMKDIYGNRLSSMLDLTNLKLHMTVHGRTDVQVGNVLRFKYPGLGAKDETSREENSIDKHYSGYYLITAIHHKINKINHSMTMECVKDSLYVDVTSN